MFKLVVEFSVKMLIIEYHLDISFRILLNESMKVYSILFLLMEFFLILFYNIHSRIFLVNEYAGRKMALAFAQSCIEW